MPATFASSGRIFTWDMSLGGEGRSPDQWGSSATFFS